MLRNFIAPLIFALLPATAFAEDESSQSGAFKASLPIVCDDAIQMLSALKDKVHEEPIVAANTDAPGIGLVVTQEVGKPHGTYTVLLINTRRQACMIESGSDWRGLTDADAVTKPSDHAPDAISLNGQTKRR